MTDWKKLEALAKERTQSITEAITNAAARFPNDEANFRAHVGPALRAFCNKADLEPLERNEYTLATGRADTVFNRLILEYKAPGVLRKVKNHRNNVEAIKQLKGYMESLAKKERHNVERLAGVILGGHHFIFVRKLKAAWHEDEPVEVRPHTTEHFLRALVSLSSGVAFTSENLIRDFGIGQLRTSVLSAGYSLPSRTPRTRW